ncbi:hypothetical protein CC1G_09821 [Coprinopsis cinerea okayama7|uniref:Uncharacterized protein n=1 Tax=Coprinopsis cinerea (strain Okayama-7 / 130 / ATCC MYA-4618 / FGSC 9003) TaxID=240176 RepID=A8P095_COPC7|nr:hypothetical protein CC1G_09821 [Coprinopsis cinerea okayama7\|eukprot:XP_001837839.2 hypothetical protein CC1G_09821 [Coprinopsis cinerea okayama7\
MSANDVVDQGSALATKDLSNPHTAKHDDVKLKPESLPPGFDMDKLNEVLVMCVEKGTAALADGPLQGIPFIGALSPTVTFALKQMLGIKETQDIIIGKLDAHPIT